jgi:hypothetical protein
MPPSDQSRVLEGAFNFRDLGGLRAGSDYRVRPGALFRSDTLQALTASDVAYLTEELRLELIIDLRIGPEAVSQGRGPMADVPVSYLNAPLRDLPVSTLPPREQSLAFYLEHLTSPTSPLATVIRVLSSMAGRPVLIHCAAGKDRTGLVSAVVLRLLGVDDADIVGDYLRSGTNMPRVVERFFSWPRYRDHIAAVPAEVYEAHEYTMRGFLDGLDRHHGGARTWAESRGITDLDVRRLRDGLLVRDVPE